MSAVGGTVDILMITYNAAAAVERSLPRLLESCDDEARVWLWHNGTDEQTLAVTRRYADHPRVHRFHHSLENQKLTVPTNWLWANSDASYVAKVDDDCLVPDEWLDRLRQAHEHNPEFGVVAGSRLLPEDVEIDLVRPKLERHAGGVELFRNHWVQGSSYLLKRAWVERQGLLGEGQTWTAWCVEAALAGAINGFVWPLLFEDHMDDPRSAHTMIRTDDDLARRLPLSARHSGLTTVAAWEQRLRTSAHEIQAAPLDLRHYRGWRRRLRSLRWRMRQRRSSRVLKNT